jgi:FkbM family methyltransferase
MTLPFKMITETDMEKYRAESFWDKEPETVAWIQSFKPGQVFFDVGANVGVYSLYAASLYPDMLIYAFEPVIANFRRLTENVELNGFDNIHCFNVAVGERDRIVDLHIPREGVGQSGAQIGGAVDEHGEAFEPSMSPKVMECRLDNFLSRRVENTHIKIDVDGREESALIGIKYFIAVDSILVECNGDAEIIEETIPEEEEFTTDNEFNRHPEHSSIRRAKEGITAQNIIFTRR